MCLLCMEYMTVCLLCMEYMIVCLLCMEGADKPALDQPAEEGRWGISSTRHSALNQAGHSAIAETTLVEPPVLDKTKKRYSVVIPYVKEVSEQMKRVMKGYGLTVYFKYTNTLRQILMQPKDKMINERVVCPVYHISYANCDESYIGEIGRSLKSRFMEHRRPSSVNSEVSRHVKCD